MDFALTKEQEMVRKMVREFAENELRPIAADIDKTCEFPKETVKKMGKLGLMGMTVPKEYGGGGLDSISYAIGVEEISRVCASHGVIMSVNNSLACYPIETYGTEEQKKRFLTPLANGEKLGAFGLTEPSAGTDAASQQTTAVLKDNEYVINGSKIFITNGAVADTIVFFAMTDKSKGTRGISAFILDKNTPGFSIGTIEDKMGIRGSVQAELVFQNMHLPKENLLGQEGKGFRIAMSTLDGGRIGIASQALGIAQAALDESLKYAKEREQFGRPIGKFQAIQWMIADMATEIQAARFLVYKAAFTKDSGNRYSAEAAMAKLYASDTAVKATRNAIQIHGGYGFIKDYPLERLYRDAKITEIYEGTSEVQRMVIAGDKLK
ncbi:MAG: acyl-CoA dehydrogenase [Methanomassiliicoccales archaeon]|nr:MAG: acyl-CoA dehydrogenase [Methanomassiliicoccales archaeon]